MEKQGRRSGVRLLEKMFATVFAVGTIFSFFFGYTVSAATNFFTIQNVELTELSATAEGSVTSFDEAGIASSVTFHKLGDTAKFKITLKNTDENEHIIESITNNNSNPYVTYEHGSYNNTTIAADAEFDFIVTAKYTTYITDTSASAQAANVKFVIKYKDAEEPQEVPLVPNTGENNNLNVGGAAQGNIIAPLVLITGLVFVIVLIRHKKHAKYAVIVAVVALAASVSSVVKAVTLETSDFAFTINFTLNPGMLIHYDGNYPDGGSMADSYWTPNGKLKPNAYTAIGYHFTGWSLEEDEEIVYGDEEPMSNIPDEVESLTLYAFWEQNEYTIVFHANSDQATGEMAPMAGKYDNRRDRLPYNEFVWEGYRFIGWKEENTGELIPDHNSAGFFKVEHGGTVNLYAQWEEVPEGIDYYKNGSDVEGVTYRQENFGRYTMLRTQNYKRDGYGFAGWNTEPDGTGIMYGPNETVELPDGGLKLYATWVKAEEDVTMQSFDDTVEPYVSYPNGKVIALIDNRDNQAYAVAKLADGKWWMIENLRLIPTGVQFTTENTNNPTPAFLASTTVTHLCAERTAACINQFAYQDSAVGNIEYSSATSLFGYGNGVYYNVSVATAGHAVVDEENLVTERVAGDICPKGWHLPSSGRDGDFSVLDIALGGEGTNFAADVAHAQKYYQAPINFVTSGWAEELYYRNIYSDAVYLTSDTDGMKQNVGVFVDSAIEIVDAQKEKYDAYTVRCLAN